MRGGAGDIGNRPILGRVSRFRDEGGGGGADGRAKKRACNVICPAPVQRGPVNIDASRSIHPGVWGRAP